MKTLNALLLALTVVALAPLCRAADGNPAPVTATQNVVDALRADGRYTLFLQSLEATGLDQTLRGAGPFIVFAPTDEAFKKVPNLAELQKNPDALKPILKYHVVPFGKTQSKDLADLKFATTLQGEELRFTKDKALQVNDANVVQADVAATNGVVHGIDRVLTPKSVPVAKGAALPPAETTTVTTTTTTTTDGTEVVYENNEGGFSGAGHTMYGGLKHGANKFKRFFTGGN